MRKVIIRGTPPVDWIADAEAVLKELRDPANIDKRQQIIEKHEKLWTDDRIRNWLLEQFNNKCWYTEAYDSVSSYHVDHYRPKGNVKNLDGSDEEGYWWLAFEWKNYRICGQLINVKKKDFFPLLEGARARATDPIPLRLEAPVLIDPITDQTRLITYEKDEDACIAIPASGINDSDKYRAEKTIELFGLNLRDRLNQKRADYWESCMMAIADYNAEGPLVIRLVQQASALKKLKSMVAYNAEFSSVSEACIRKHASQPLMASVFEHPPIG